MKIKKLALTGIALALFTIGFTSTSIAQDTTKNQKSVKTETKSTTEKKGDVTTNDTSKKTTTTKHSKKGKKSTTEVMTTTKTDNKAETDKK